MRNSICYLILLIISAGPSFAQNVGIGTQSPQAKLQVSGRFAEQFSPSLLIEDSSETGMGEIRFTNKQEVNAQIVARRGYGSQAYQTFMDFRLENSVMALSQQNVSIPSQLELGIINYNPKKLVIYRQQDAQSSIEMMNRTNNCVDFVAGNIIFNHHTGLDNYSITGTIAPSDNNSGISFKRNSTDLLNITGLGRIGIGIASPDYKLDVLGRAQIRGTLSETAGIWLKNDGVPTNTFIGLYDNNHVGLFAQPGGWGLLMNTVTGRTGIKTDNPSADLDINGSLRLRAGAANGKVLVSDANGNASWKTQRVAFDAGSAVEQNFTAGQTLILQFNRVNFQDGGALIAGPNVNTTFAAPVTGMYHFDIAIHVQQSGSAGSSPPGYLELVWNNTVVQSHIHAITGTQTVTYQHKITLSRTMHLSAGDQIRVQYRSDTPGTLGGGLGDYRESNFSGFLVYAY